MSALRTTAPSLFERVEEIQVLTKLLDLMDSEDTSPDHAKAMEAEILGAIATTQAHVDRTTAVLAAMEAAELYAGKEAARMQQHATRISQQRERLEQYCIAVLTSKGLKKIDGFSSTLSIRTNPPAVEIAADAELPAEFLRQPPTPPPPPTPEPAPDKTAIKAALTRGEFVPGCRLTRAIKLVRS
jgi:Siphovirus Gp157